MIQQVVGEGAGAAAEGAAGDVAKAVVAVDAVIGGLGAVVGAGRPARGGVQPDELMGVTGAIQILLLRAGVACPHQPVLLVVGGRLLVDRKIRCHVPA